MSDIAQIGDALGTKEMTLISHDPRETYAIGKMLGERLAAGDVLALSGELGAGKTCLTQGIAAGLGISEEYLITSPTFTIINEYPGRLTLYHLDMYRLADAGELWDIGFEDCFNNRGVVVIEWAEKFLDDLPAGTLFILLTYLDANKRQIVLSRGREKISRLLRAAQGDL